MYGIEFNGEFKLDDMKDNISKHITYEESTHSNTAVRKGITNSPTDEHLKNMQRVANDIFEPCREHFGEPIIINSFYRSLTLNSAVGGSNTSEHCFGSAIDARFGYDSERSNAELFHYIKDNFEFSQLIWEFGNAESPKWVHFSLLSDNNRGQVLRAKRIDGVVRYNPFI